MGLNGFAIVLRASGLHATRRFYEAIGLSFVEERHGNGPLHLAADVGKAVLEIHPLRPGERMNSGTSMTFAMAADDLDGTVLRFRELGCAVSGPATSGSVTVRDPDGRPVRLTRRDPPGIQ